MDLDFRLAWKCQYKKMVDNEKIPWLEIEADIGIFYKLDVLDQICLTRLIYGRPSFCLIPEVFNSDKHAKDISVFCIMPTLLNTSNASTLLHLQNLKSFSMRCKRWNLIMLWSNSARNVKWHQGLNLYLSTWQSAFPLNKLSSIIIIPSLGKKTIKKSWHTKSFSQQSTSWTVSSVFGSHLLSPW